VGQSMFQACKDHLCFLEQLNGRGFAGGLFVIHVIDPLFFDRGTRDGIYAYFRGTEAINGNIEKPMGARNEKVYTDGRYHVKWLPCGEGRVWIQEVTTASPFPSSGEGFYLVDGVPHGKLLGILAEDDEPVYDGKG